MLVLGRNICGTHPFFENRGGAGDRSFSQKDGVCRYSVNPGARPNTLGPGRPSPSLTPGSFPEPDRPGRPFPVPGWSFRVSHNSLLKQAVNGNDPPGTGTQWQLFPEVLFRFGTRAMNSSMLLSPTRNSLFLYRGWCGDAVRPDMVRLGPADRSGPFVPAGPFVRPALPCPSARFGPLVRPALPRPAARSGPLVRPALPRPAAPIGRAALLGRAVQPVPALQVVLAVALGLWCNRQKVT